jgi:hypothetical protein
MAAGAAGINLHGNPANCHGYSPVCASTPSRLAAGILTAQPEWYGLLLDAALIGGRPIRTTVRSANRANVDVTTMLAPDGGLRFVIVDDDPPGATPVIMRLHVGRNVGAAKILALTAPSLVASSHVLLGGRTVAPDGAWREPTSLPHSPNRRGIVTLTVPPSSAMLVTVTTR